MKLEDTNIDIESIKTIVEELRGAFHGLTHNGIGRFGVEAHFNAALNHRADKAQSISYTARSKDRSRFH